MPANYILFTLSGILSGCIFYGEFWRYPFLELLMYMLGTMLTFGGVFLVAGRRNFRTKKQGTLVVENSCSGESEFDELHGLYDAEMEKKILGW